MTPERFERPTFWSGVRRQPLRHRAGGQFCQNLWGYYEDFWAKCFPYSMILVGSTLAKKTSQVGSTGLLDDSLIRCFTEELSRVVDWTLVMCCLSLVDVVWSCRLIVFWVYSMRPLSCRLSRLLCVYWVYWLVLSCRLVCLWMADPSVLFCRRRAWLSLWYHTS